MRISECLRFDWNKIRSAGGAAKVPEAIYDLYMATSELDALNAYWRIDNTVIVQGALYESAEISVPCLLSILPDGNDVGRKYVLELLQQLGLGEVPPEERRKGNAELKNNVLKEISYGLSQYFNFLENGTSEEKGFCADLIEICAEHDDSLRERSVWWLKRQLLIERNPETKAAFEACLANLSKKNLY